MRSPTSSDRPRAFTLVELLVVIGIITVLIAILLPVLRKARDQARTVVCASNMRQLGIAALAYCSANKGILPTPEGFPPNQLPYDAISSLGRGVLEFQTGTLWPYLGNDIGTRQRVFNCPSDDGDPRTFFDDDTGGQLLLPGVTRNFSYSYNGFLNRPFGPRGGTAGVPIVQVRHPVDKMLVVEEEGPVFPSSGISNATGPHGVNVYLTKRHDGLCNVCFFDGHVEKLNPRVFANGSPNILVPAYYHYADIFSNR